MHRMLEKHKRCSHCGTSSGCWRSHSQPHLCCGSATGDVVLHGCLEVAYGLTVSRVCVVHSLQARPACVNVTQICRSTHCTL